MLNPLRSNLVPFLVLFAASASVVFGLAGCVFPMPDFDNPVDPKNRPDTFTTPGMEWVRLTEDAPMGTRTNYGFAAYDDQLWVVNGDVWSSPDGENWTQVLNDTGFGSGGGALPLGAYDGELYVIADGELRSTTDGTVWTGHENPPASTELARRLVEYDGFLWSIGEDTAARFDGTSWATFPIENTLADPVYGEHVPVVYDGALWSVGGEIFETGIVTSQDGENWETRPSNFDFTQRHWAAGEAFDQGIVILGGWVGGPTNDVLFSSDGTEWSIETAPFLPRERFLAARLDDRIYFYGGNSGGEGEEVPADVWYVELTGDP